MILKEQPEIGSMTLEFCGTEFALVALRCTMLRSWTVVSVLAMLPRRGSGWVQVSAHPLGS